MKNNFWNYFLGAYIALSFILLCCLLMEITGSKPIVLI